MASPRPAWNGIAIQEWLTTPKIDIITYIWFVRIVGIVFYFYKYIFPFVNDFVEVIKLEANNKHTIEIQFLKPTVDVIVYRFAIANISFVIT